MTFLILVAVVAIAYFAWRVVDQLPDIVYRLSEIQRDVADLRRRAETGDPAGHASSQAESSAGAAEESEGEAGDAERQ